MRDKLLGVLIAVLILSIVFSGCFEEKPTIKKYNIYVNDDGSADYTSIQSAIDVANENASIFVYSGIYSENIVIHKSITLIGENKETTIIDGGGDNGPIHVRANNVNVSGFTLQNGLVGIGLFSCFNTTISNNIIYNNADVEKYMEVTGIILKAPIWPYAGINLIYSSFNRITENIIIANVGAGITLSMSNNNYIFGNNITNNSYGAYLVSSSNNTITTNTIMNNTDTGIYLTFFSNNNTPYNNNFINNTKNAYDNCSNTWDGYQKQYYGGNYWDDYTEKYPDANQIEYYLVGFTCWDIPYNISGGNNQDKYPLVHQVYI